MNLFTILLLQYLTTGVPGKGLLMYNVTHGHSTPELTDEELRKCFIANKLMDCLTSRDRTHLIKSARTHPNVERTGAPEQETIDDSYGISEHEINPLIPAVQPMFKSVHIQKHPPSLKLVSILRKRIHKNYPIPRRRFISQFTIAQINNIETPLHSRRPLLQSVDGTGLAIDELQSKALLSVETSASVVNVQMQNEQSAFDNFLHHLDEFERKFYTITFSTLSAATPIARQENGMSFVQSGFYLMLSLMVLSTEVDTATRAEIDQCTGYPLSNEGTTHLVRQLMSYLPGSSERLQFRRSSRLSLSPECVVSPAFRSGPADAMQLKVDKFNDTGTLTEEELLALINKKVEIDSGGALRNTFDEEDLSDGVKAILVTIMYFRGRWRAAPIALNGTRPFRDSDETPHRTVRMIRINDHINYARLRDWDAEALEIQYAEPGLSLLMLVPRTPSLRRLAKLVDSTGIYHITNKMRPKRIAVTMPLFTLRMTLLLPKKLQAMGISRLVDTSDPKIKSLRLSHAAQRLMFWAEAGRNAFKDDGVEWDEAPQSEVVVDRPYVFFVRWRNITIMNGNFAL